LPPFFFLFPDRLVRRPQTRFFKPQLTENVPRLLCFPAYPQAASCGPVAGMPHSTLGIAGARQIAQPAAKLRLPATS
jgi:hypothetical protein